MPRVKLFNNIQYINKVIIWKIKNGGDYIQWVEKNLLEFRFIYYRDALEFICSVSCNRLISLPPTVEEQNFFRWWSILLTKYITCYF